MANPSTVCDAAKLLATRAHDDLRDARRYGLRVHKQGGRLRLKQDFRLREDTITDFILLDLCRWFPGAVKTFSFTGRAENLAGADLLVVIRRRGAQPISLLIQAKSSDDTGRYLYMQNRQIARLINAARRLRSVPLYFFYNNCDIPPLNLRTSCRQCANCTFTAEQWAISVASAVDVRNAANRPKTLTDFEPFSDPLMCLFCCHCAAGQAPSLSKQILAWGGVPQDGVSPDVADDLRELIEALWEGRVPSGKKAQKLASRLTKEKTLIAIVDEEQIERN